MKIVLFGVGSPLAIDAEESCARSGIEIAAAVRNVEGGAHVTSAVRVVSRDGIDDALRRCEVVLPLFTPANRRAAWQDALGLGFAGAATLIDPTTVVARSARIGKGVYVNAGCVVAGNCELGDFVLVNRSASIGHDARLSEFVSIGPGAVLAGSITVGRGALIGAGAVLLPEISVGENAIVGAGAVVTRPVPAGRTVVGNPARLAKK